MIKLCGPSNRIRCEVVKEYQRGPAEQLTLLTAMPPPFDASYLRSGTEDGD